MFTSTENSTSIDGRSHVAHDQMTTGISDRPPLVSVDWRDAVAEVVINNPPVNALTRDLMDQLRETLTELSERARVIVISSALPQVFMAGGDLALMANGTPEQHERYVSHLQSTFGLLASFRGPVITLVDGHCIGGGLELALAGDLILSSEHSTFSLPEARLGILPAAGGIHRLVRRIGEGRARYLMITARRVGAQRALDIGIVDELHPQEDLLEAGRSLAQTLAAYPTRAVGEIKRLTNEALDTTVVEGLTDELASWMQVRPEPETETALRHQLERPKR